MSTRKAPIVSKEDLHYIKTGMPLEPNPMKSTTELFPVRDPDIQINWQKGPPPRDKIDYYGDRFSVPVWLITGRAARWDYNMNGWVDYNFAGGCDPDDYDDELPRDSEWIALPKAERAWNGKPLAPAQPEKKPKVQDVFPAPKKRATVVPKAKHTNRRINANRGDAVRAAKKAGLVEGESTNQRRARMSAQLRSVLPKKLKPAKVKKGGR